MFNNVKRHVTINAFQLGLCALLVAGLAACSVFQPTTMRQPAANCGTDTTAIVISPGWKLGWQQEFDRPIARPPIIYKNQMILVERDTPDAENKKDTVLVVDPHSGAVQQKFTDVAGLEGYASRSLLTAKASQKYWLLIMQYVKPDGEPFPRASQYEIVLDRETGHVIYESGPLDNYPILASTITDEALFDNYDTQYMRRIDLPTGETRWMKHWDSRDSRGMFAYADELVIFATDIQRYAQTDGSLASSITYSLYPIPGDVTIQGNLAVIRSQNSANSNTEGVGVFDLQNSELLWKLQIDYLYDKGSNAFWGDIPSITVSSDSIYLFDAQDALLRIDILTGRQLWRAPSPGHQAMARPVIMNDAVYALFADGSVRAFDKATGKPLGVVALFPIWYRKNTDNKDFLDLVGGLDVTDDSLIVTTGCRTVYAIQREK